MSSAVQQRPFDTAELVAYVTFTLRMYCAVG